MAGFQVLFLVYLVFISCSFEASEAELSKSVRKIIKKINNRGPYIGLLVPSSSELQPFFESSSFKSLDKFPHIDCAGRRFYIGKIKDKDKKKMIIAMTGKGMMNAAIAAQMLGSLFRVTSILHYGLAGNANEDLNVGDVVIPQFWAHTGLWHWQRYGDGPDDELSLEEDGDFTRDYGSLNFADYNNNTDAENSPDNVLNSIWYQPEEIFHADGGPYSKKFAFWVPIADTFFELAKKLEGMKLKGCINTNTCLPKTPRVATVHRGSSANIYLDNVAYKSFLHSKFQVSPVDMESAAIALISYQHNIPFIAFRALSDLAGESSIKSNETKTFFSVLIENCIKVLINFIKNMEEPDDISSM